MSFITKLRCHSSSSLWVRASSSLMTAPIANRSIVSATKNSVNCRIPSQTGASYHVQNIFESYIFDQRRWSNGAPDGNIKEAVYTEDQRKQDHMHCVEMVQTRDFEGYCKCFLSYIYSCLFLVHYSLNDTYSFTFQYAAY